MVSLKIKTVRNLERRNRYWESCKPPQARFIESVLSEEELDAIDNTEGMGIEDYFLIALTNKITSKSRAVERYERMHVLDMKHYMSMSRRWLEHEQRALQHRLGRRPTFQETNEDFKKNDNGRRHRIYYCLKFPENVSRE